jgi:hypothetical protein
MRAFSRWVEVFAALLFGGTPSWAGDATPEPGTSVEMPYLIAPVVVNGTLVSNAYISSKIVATSPAATITIRDRLPFIQDAFVRDVNAAPIGKASDPATVDSSALAARLLADAKRMAGPNLIVTVEIIRVQLAALPAASR